MENQKLQLSPEAQKAKLFNVWIVKQNEPIEITFSQYRGLLNCLNDGKKFAKIDWNIIMINSITLIEPKEKPLLGMLNYSTGEYDNQKKLKIWQEIFENKNNLLE